MRSKLKFLWIKKLLKFPKMLNWLKKCSNLRILIFKPILDNFEQILIISIIFWRNRIQRGMPWRFLRKTIPNLFELSTLLYGYPCQYIVLWRIKCSKKIKTPKSNFIDIQSYIFVSNLKINLTFYEKSL